MRIEDFGVSQPCYQELIRAGFTEAEEIVEFLGKLIPGVMVEADWPICLDEILSQIKRLGLWTPEWERKWPSLN